MSDKEKKREQSMRLFEALSGISPELLARSEKKVENKVIRLWGGRFGRTIAACLAVLLVGGVSLYAVKYTNSWKGTDNAALQNGAAGGSSSYIRQGIVAEQFAEPIEADGQEEAAADMLYSMDTQQLVNESGGCEENVAPAGQQSSLNETPEQGKDSSLVYNDLEKDIGSGNQKETEGTEKELGFGNQKETESAEKDQGTGNRKETEDTEKESLAGLSAMQGAAGFLAEEDVTRMGSLAAYAPVSIPSGYTVSDTRIAVDKSGIGNYVIEMRSQEGNVLEYRVSRGEENDGEMLEDVQEASVICVADLKGEKIEEELTKAKSDGQAGTVVAILYGDGVRVEVRGDYTLEILREICPEE